MHGCDEAVVSLTRRHLAAAQAPGPGPEPASSWRRAWRRNARERRRLARHRCSLCIRTAEIGKRRQPQDASNPFSGGVPRTATRPAVWRRTFRTQAPGGRLPIWSGAGQPTGRLVAERRVYLGPQLRSASQTLVLLVIRAAHCKRVGELTGRGPCPGGCAAPHVPGQAHEPLASPTHHAQLGRAIMMGLWRI